MAVHRLLVILCLSALAPACLFGKSPAPPFESDGGSENNNDRDDVGVPLNDVATPDVGEDAGADATGNDEDTNVPDQGSGDDVGPDMPVELCGNGTLDPGEDCDPAIDADETGSCPMMPADCPEDGCGMYRIDGVAADCTARCVTDGANTSCGMDDDDCCPTGCGSHEDNDCTKMCGNDVVEPDEFCDGNCPMDAADCDDGQSCTADTVEGSAASCDAICVSQPITSCTDDDGCCPSLCDSSSDNDCSASCGDGIVDANETCDGDCPTSCDDMDVCTFDSLEGSAGNCTAECVFTDITQCIDDDGCCAPGCNANDDTDCDPVCGNDVIEDGETCDGNCPSDCADADVCTEDVQTGTAGTCDVVCTNDDITTCSMTSDGCCAPGCNANNDADCMPVCGNGVIEDQETCDGNCATSCDDGDICTENNLTGDPSTCDVSCDNPVIDYCDDTDGCCPSQCDSTTDADCNAVCGNDIVESGETCDGNCPSVCPTVCHSLTGSPGNCDVQCVTDPDCTPCDRNGVCPCADGEECNGGKCETSDGDGCTNACDEDAFCAVHGGAGWVCDQNDDFCKECLDDTHCEVYELCTQNACAPPDTCDQAPSPDVWCEKFKDSGSVCDQGECKLPCNDDTECEDYETCSSGLCETPDQCTGATRPNLWCERFTTADICLTDGTCAESCDPQSCMCDPLQDCQNTDVADGTADICVDVDSCPAACDPNDWCIKKHNGVQTAACTTNKRLAAWACVNWDTCNTKSECHAIEACVSGDCTYPPPNCGLAREPDTYCQWRNGTNSVCEMRSIPPSCTN